MILFLFQLKPGYLHLFIEMYFKGSFNLIYEAEAGL